MGYPVVKKTDFKGVREDFFLTSGFKDGWWRHQGQVLPLTYLNGCVKINEFMLQ